LSKRGSKWTSGVAGERLPYWVVGTRDGVHVM
jgi:hypothetical protein